MTLCYIFSYNYFDKKLFYKENMMSNLNFIYNRKSIREFKDVEIPKEDILELIKNAVEYANNVVFEKSKTDKELERNGYYFRHLLHI